MECVRGVFVTLALLSLSCGGVKGEKSTRIVPPNCDFPAIYNFGDSNSDTGGASATFGPIPPPYGESFFRRPAGRASDGRLIVDFIDKDAKRLPRPREFSRALYTFDIGQNDLTVGFRKLSATQLQVAITDIVNQFANAVTRLYQYGARVFWIHNTGPIGCLPAASFYIRNPKRSTFNKYGCVNAHNKMAIEFNRQLKTRVMKLRHELPRASLVYVDIYAAKYKLIRNAKYYESANETMADCHYPAIYNFGDSNSDTGGISAAFYPAGSPSGQTYFHRPAGRASDGRLIIDFIAEHLGLPYLSAYLDSIGTNFSHGANFATGGATIMRPNESWFVSGVSPFNLEIQVEHYTQLKEKTAYFYNQDKDLSLRSRLPNPEEFSEALFTLDIGQNDVASGIRKWSFERQKQAIPDIVREFIGQVRNLYGKGARTIWIHNTGPIGCLPVTTAKVQNPTPGYLDEHGCVKNQNDIAIELNKQLKDEIIKLRVELSEAAIIYVDMYTAKYELISSPKNKGFEDSIKICCGDHGIGYDIWCGNKGTVNGSDVYAGSCANPSTVISWDGVHYSEAANHWIANRILNGSLSDPPIPIKRACQKKI